MHSPNCKKSQISTLRKTLIEGDHIISQFLVLCNVQALETGR